MHLTSSQHQLGALASRSFTNGVSSPRKGPFWYRGESACSSDPPSHFLISSAWRFPFCHVLLSFVLPAKDCLQPTVLVFISDCWLAFVMAQLPTEPYFIYHVPEAGLSIRRYLHKPYLISGSKFDLRIYVYVTCYDPLRIYLFSDGLVRFASCKYVLVVKCHLNRSGDLLS